MVRPVSLKEVLLGGTADVMTVQLTWSVERSME